MASSSSSDGRGMFARIKLRLSHVTAIITSSSSPPRIAPNAPSQDRRAAIAKEIDRHAQDMQRLADALLDTDEEAARKDVARMMAMIQLGLRWAIRLGEAHRNGLTRCASYAYAVDA